MTKPGSWARSLLLPAACLVLLLAAFLAGFVASDRHLLPEARLQQAKALLRGAFGSTADTAATEINTALLRLSIASTQVPGDVELRGGGITRQGASLLGVTGSGEFFASSDGRVLPLDIAPPDNHLDDYRRAAATGELASLQHNFSLVRYNAPLYVASGGRRLLFLTYTEWQPQQDCYLLALARLELPPAAEPAALHAGAGDWKVVFRTQPCLPLLTTHEALQGHMGGGAMAFDESAGRLLLATGDYRVDGVYAPAKVSQEEGSSYGRLLSMDLDGNAVTEIARGLRNPQGLLLLADGRIWSTEHGPRGGDELNLVIAGGNYGWPFRTLGTRYSSLPWPLSPTNGRHDGDDGFIGPVYAWVPSVGISGLAQVDGFDPAWDGDLLAASLRGQTLYRLRLAGGHVQYAEPINLQDRIRQVLPMPDGTIALWTDSRRVMVLRKAAESRTLLRARREMAALGHGDEARTRRLEAALQACMECHSLDPDAPGSIPHLSGIHGRAVAATGYAAYSPALRDAGGRWTSERLATFLTDPQRFAPGTAMPSPQLPAETVGDLVALLERLGSPE